LGQILEEFQRYGHHFGLMLFDVDSFEQINDQHGHSSGDQALKVAGQTLVRSLRSSDSVGRWGGDEFMAILPQVTTENLQRLAERCRTLMEQS
jgi:diguanylate cyclase (GGDEF)-like protein